MSSLFYLVCAFVYAVSQAFQIPAVLLQALSDQPDHLPYQCCQVHGQLQQCQFRCLLQRSCSSFQIILVVKVAG